MIVDRALVAAALPGYELGDQIGAGAFGLVLAGRHRRLQRDVAIKVLAAGRHDGVAAGFAAEAVILAGLDHPHIVRVYDYVETDDLHLIVMEMLSGGTLTRHQASMSQQEACAVGLAVAGALSCAHSRGVLHRDIKPDNVLFDSAGLLKVVDFGIAKLLGGAAATASAVIGTPLFMAPEQIVKGRLGPATDLYALGVMLYLLLTGNAPLDPATQAQVLWGHRFNHRVPPPAGVPASVAEVVLRALAKVPTDRPPSAHAFAVDLARAAASAYGPGWIASSGISLMLDEDVRAASELPAASAHQPTPPLTDSGPSPAHPTGDTTQDGSTGRNTTGYGRHTRSSPRRAAAPRHRLAAVVVLLLLTVAGTVFVSAAARDRIPGEPNANTAEPGPSARQTPVPTAHLLGRPLTHHTDWVTSVAFSPDGHTLASASRDTTVRLWDVTDRSKPLPLGTPLTGHTSGVMSVAFSPDGRTLASASRDTTVRLWDVTDRSKPLPLGRPLTGHTDAVHSVAFSGDLRTLASSGRDRTVRLWDITDRSNPLPLGTPITDHVDWVGSVAFSGEGRTLASASLDNTVRLWNMTDRSKPRALGPPITGHTGGIGSAAFSPDVQILVSSGRDSTVRLWGITDRSDPRPLGPPMTGHTKTVWPVSFSPNGRTVASGSYDTTVRLWDVTNQSKPRPIGTPLTGHTDWIWSVAFSPDGRILASASKDKTIRLWALP